MSVTSYDGGRLGTEEILSGASEVGFENASIEFFQRLFSSFLLDQGGSLHATGNFFLLGPIAEITAFFHTHPYEAL